MDHRARSLRGGIFVSECLVIDATQVPKMPSVGLIDNALDLLLLFERDGVLGDPRLAYIEEVLGELRGRLA